MAEDIRESILARLQALMEAIAGTEVERNVLVDDDTDRTRIVLLEGDEISREEDPPRPANAPRIVFMLPQILVSVGAKSTDLGPQLSALRGKVMQAITTDATLIGLTHKGEGGRYLGMESDLAFGRTMAGQMALKYQFAYVLRPDRFA